MPYAFPPDLQQQLNEHMTRGAYVSEDDVLRDAFAALSWEEDEFAATMQAVGALDEGDEGIELNATFEQLRRKHGIQIEKTIKWMTSTDAAT